LKELSRLERDDIELSVLSVTQSICGLAVAATAAKQLVLQIVHVVEQTVSLKKADLKISLFDDLRQIKLSSLRMTYNNALYTCM